MRRIIFSASVIIMLSACVGTNRDIQVLPSLTIVPSSTHAEVATSIIKASETPLPSPSSTPVPLSLILADFPLALGTTWVYSAEISYQDPNDYMKLLTWTGTITDKVVDKKVESDGKMIFTVQEDLEPKPPKDVWRQSRTFEYIIVGDGVFEGAMKVYQYPLKDNLTWRAFADFEYDMNAYYVGEVITPYGKLDNCYSLLIATNPDTSIEIFCAGVGFVEHSYRHHGTPQDEKFVLSSFTLGQP
jgi:hypothetical protein